jgi:hypothetical protein
MLYNLIVKATGAYTGSLLLNGAACGLAGSFDVTGHATETVKRSAAQGGSVVVEMTLGWTNGEITGTVSNGGTRPWISELYAEKSAMPSAESAEYTVLLEPGSNAVGAIPPGFGYVLITNHNGSVTLSGALADGSVYSQNAPLGVSNDVPVYARLYANAGLLLGWLGLSNGNVLAETPMAWIKPSVRSGIYSAGFTNMLSVAGSGWTNTGVSTNGLLTISSSSVDLIFQIAINGNTIGNATNSPTNSLAGSINPKTGLMTVTFGNGNGRAVATGHAALLQGASMGGGFFTTSTNAGLIDFASGGQF